MTYCTKCGSQNTIRMSDSDGEPFVLEEKPNVVRGDARYAGAKSVDLIYSLCMCNDCGNLFALVGKDTEGIADKLD